MRKHFVATLALVALTTMLAVTRSNVTAQVRDKTNAAFKAAMDKETVEGDLRGAISSYKSCSEPGSLDCRQGAHPHGRVLSKARRRAGADDLRAGRRKFTPTSPMPSKPPGRAWA